ncbi:MAG: pyrroline-5-carboxylate reductase [Dehalococcoidia bacterium]|nr:pyrroline-5-carboxylate reductase [Dehalococcoidia bacterium]
MSDGIGTLALVGGGVMGEAIVKRLLDLGITTAAQVRVAEVSGPRRDALTAGYGFACTPDIADASSGADTILLAVKPQNMSDVFAACDGKLRANQLVVSIAAGVTLKTLTQGLNHHAVVRVMPNTPAQTGQGMSVWTAEPHVTEAQRATVQQILAAVGDELYVAGERYIDMATAINGSGPAYVFLFIEALIDAGVHIGLPRDVAERLALQTVAGSAAYAKQTGLHPAVLRNMVTSPGGTTTEALLALQQQAFPAAIISAVQAAYEKSIALGRDQHA